MSDPTDVPHQPRVYSAQMFALGDIQLGHLNGQSAALLKTFTWSDGPLSCLVGLHDQLFRLFKLIQAREQSIYWH